MALLLLRQDWSNRASGYLDDHGGDKQAEDQFGAFERGKYLARMQHVFFLHRGELFPHAEQRQQEADKQHRGGNKEHGAQAILVSQQAANQGTTDAAGRESAQRPTAAMAWHLGSNQRIGVGNKAAPVRKQPSQVMNRLRCQLIGSATGAIGFRAGKRCLALAQGKKLAW